MVLRTISLRLTAGPYVTGTNGYDRGSFTVAAMLLTVQVVCVFYYTVLGRLYIQLLYRRSSDYRTCRTVCM